jgi:hypothetical protein
MIVMPTSAYIVDRRRMIAVFTYAVVTMIVS